MNARGRQRQCSCCCNFLTASDKDKSSKLNPKCAKCNFCHKTVCRYCRDNGRCHECTVKLSVAVLPVELMKLTRIQLVAYLTVMHYPKEEIETWSKPYLVKQMLTRFQVCPDWDPAEHLNDDDGIERTTPARPKKARTPKRSQDASGHSRVHSADSHVYDLPLAKQQQSRAHLIEAPPKPQRPPSLSRARCISMRNISSADRFDDMSVADLDALLKEWMDDERRRHGNANDLRAILRYLWDKGRSMSYDDLSTLDRPSKHRPREQARRERDDSSEMRAHTGHRDNQPRSQVQATTRTQQPQQDHGHHCQYNQQHHNAVANPQAAAVTPMGANTSSADWEGQLYKVWSPGCHRRPLTVVNNASELMELQRIRNNLKRVVMS